MSIDKTVIVKALAKVTDPNSGRDIITMSMVRDLSIDGKNINFTIELPSLNNQYKSELNFACISAVQEAYPDANVNVHLMSKTPQAQQAEKKLPHIGNI